jgi:DNA-binding transcriptional regulator YdaS (Cro superfamily)
MMKYKTINTLAIKEAIEIAGGANKLALKIQASYQTILNWKNARGSISPYNCLKIEQATDGKVKAKDILPDYPWDDLK